MAIRLSTTKILDGTEAVALTTHRGSIGTDHLNVAQRPRIVVVGLEAETLNDENTAVMTLAAGDQFVPLMAIFHMEAVGVGAAANGDMHVTMGTSAGGTQLLPDTTLTSLIDLNDRFVVALTGLTDPIIGTATIYVKNIQADTTAGAGHLVDIYLIGETFTSGA